MLLKTPSHHPSHRLEGFTVAGILTGLAATAAAVVLGTLVTARIAQRGMRQAENTVAGIKSAIAGSLNNLAMAGSGGSIQPATADLPSPLDDARSGDPDESPVDEPGISGAAVESIPAPALFRGGPCEAWRPAGQTCGIFWHRRIWIRPPMHPLRWPRRRTGWFKPLPRRPR
jgi:hypothetical protein